MIKIEKTEVYGWEAAIRGMRNPKNSWDRSDSYPLFLQILGEDEFNENQSDGLIPEAAVHHDGAPTDGCDFIVGNADKDLMMRLAKGGSVHAKYRRMITVTCDITAPLYWWKEFDTYKVGTVANSCSTMHKIHSKPFTLDDFSCDHLNEKSLYILNYTLEYLNAVREIFVAIKDKSYWWQMIQLLPSSYNQKRTILMNYEVLVGMYRDRKNHKLDEWYALCDWIRNLPHSDLIVGDADGE